MGESESTATNPSSSNKSTNFINVFFRLLAYDTITWFFNLIIHTFFRDVQTRGSFNIPQEGPIIFVIAPHNNQFVDGLVVMTKVKEISSRRISFLIAKKSYNKRIIGDAAKLCGAIPVERAQDLLKPAIGEIMVDSNDDKIIIGKETNFTKQCQSKGLIGLPDNLGNTKVSEIIDDTKLILKRPFTSSNKETQDKINTVLKNGTKFKTASQFDNHVVFQNVFNHLNQGGVLGIFPEATSHDRLQFIPLKSGVAIFALGAVSQQIEKFQNGEINQITPVRVVPIGLSYFHPHKFRSRVVMEFGKPIIVDQNLAQEYNENSKDSINKLMKHIEFKLKEVTMNCNDYETLMVLQAARRLYTSGNRKNIPLPMVIEMNRRLIKGYEQYKDQPDVKELKNSVLEYNKQLMRLNLHDHQVESLNRSTRIHNIWMFSKRFFTFILFMSLSLPGIILFGPIFIIAKRISKIKAKEALANSTVKIKAKDVISSWKILVAMVLAPMLYSFWSIIGTIIIIKFKILGKYQPSYIFIFLYFYCWAILTTYASLRIGEIGVDYYKSLTPLFLSILSINQDNFQIEKLKNTRNELRIKVNEFCDKYGPGIFKDYDEFYKKYNKIDDEDGDEEEYEIISNETVSNQNKLNRQISGSSDSDPENVSNIPIMATSDSDHGDEHSPIRSNEPEEAEEQGKFNKETSEVVTNNNNDDDDSVQVRLRKSMKDKQFDE
ncbi:uncharacterized protein KGF55_004898 [Candida pseudojiufengensis]|uniref:uncharacterized protein n=1 Tax=Candida pseudojiufengensis TaxID=497109 RepID=UPI002224B9FE|nr:uncharacterized protein KGF55_004898 [Candida pseudojiufengensis]KAI5960175.1 hypothetical protein KGF55_004898 [Candida pseudojiufengensis]